MDFWTTLIGNSFGTCFFGGHAVWIPIGSGLAVHGPYICSGHLHAAQGAQCGSMPLRAFSEGSGRR